MCRTDFLGKAPFGRFQSWPSNERGTKAERFSLARAGTGHDYAATKCQRASPFLLTRGSWSACRFCVS
jgi:hypothetical protein